MEIVNIFQVGGNILLICGKKEFPIAFEISITSKSWPSVRERFSWERIWTKTYLNKEKKDVQILRLMLKQLAFTYSSKVFVFFFMYSLNINMKHKKNLLLQGFPLLRVNYWVEALIHFFRCMERNVILTMSNWWWIMCHNTDIKKSILFFLWIISKRLSTDMWYLTALTRFSRV